VRGTRRPTAAGFDRVTGAATAHPMRPSPPVDVTVNPSVRAHRLQEAPRQGRAGGRSAEPA
jgi:hypothetical protein